MATIAAPPVTKTTLDVLRDARALYSENPSHAPVGDTPADGTYCVATAIDDVAERLTGGHAVYYAAMRQFFHATGESLFDTFVPQWNAEHTTEEVLEVWDRAIAALEAA